MRFLEQLYNRLLGRGFFWRDGALHPKPGTCPYPVNFDWSVRACIKAGDCGCDERCATDRR